MSAANPEEDGTEPKVPEEERTEQPQCDAVSRDDQRDDALQTTGEASFDVCVQELERKIGEEQATIKRIQAASEACKTNLLAKSVCCHCCH